MISLQHVMPDEDPLGDLLRDEDPLGDLLRDEDPLGDLLRDIPDLSVSLTWCAGTTSVPEVFSEDLDDIRVHLLSRNVGGRVVYAMDMQHVSGVLTALIDSRSHNLFVPSIHDQYFSPDIIDPTLGPTTCGVITLDCDSVTPERFERHQCAVVNGVQTCCSFEHFSVLLGCSSLITMLGLEQPTLDTRERLRPPRLERRKTLPTPSPDLATRHRTVFSLARELLLDAPDRTLPRGEMMRMLAEKVEIKNLYPHKGDTKAVYHALRNLFQSSRLDALMGNTYYTPRGLTKMDARDRDAKDVIWTYRMSNNKFYALYIG